MKIRQAECADVDTLLPLMRGYYRADGLEFDIDRARHTLMRLLSEPQWGRVYLLEFDDRAVGYIAICIGFSLELGGNDAVIDEVFVLPEYRGRGFAGHALQTVIDRAAELGIKALHLEVDRANASAQQLYSALGFSRRDRYFIMTATLDG